MKEGDTIRLRENPDRVGTIQDVWQDGGHVMARVRWEKTSERRTPPTFSTLFIEDIEEVQEPNRIS